LTKRPQRHRTWTVQSCSPGDANATPCNICLLGSPEPTTQTTYRLVQPFLHSSPQRVHILYNKLPHFRSELPLHMGRFGPNLFLGPTGFQTANGISIGLAIFARLTIVTDRSTDTDRPRYSVGSSRPHLYVRSTAMHAELHSLGEYYCNVYE